MRSLAVFAFFRLTMPSSIVRDLMPEESVTVVDNIAERLCQRGRE